MKSVRNGKKARNAPSANIEISIFQNYTNYIKPEADLNLTDEIFIIPQ